MAAFALPIFEPFNCTHGVLTDLFAARPQIGPAADAGKSGKMGVPACFALSAAI
jgi:hypothetical protein